MKLLPAHIPEPEKKGTFKFTDGRAQEFFKTIFSSPEESPSAFYDSLRYTEEQILKTCGIKNEFVKGGETYQQSGSVDHEAKDAFESEWRVRSTDSGRSYGPPFEFGARVHEMFFNEMKSEPIWDTKVADRMAEDLRNGYKNIFEQKARKAGKSYKMPPYYTVDFGWNKEQRYTPPKRPDIIVDQSAYLQKKYAAETAKNLKRSRRLQMILDKEKILQVRFDILNGVDLHRKHAAEMFGVAMEDVTPKQREAAKKHYYFNAYK